MYIKKEANTSFNNIKEMLVHDTLLVYLDFGKYFHLDADASKTQVGNVMCQDHSAIACHSRRLIKHHKN